MSDDYTKRGGVVRDESLDLNEANVQAEYTPGASTEQSTRNDPPELRESTKATRGKGVFEEADAPKGEKYFSDSRGDPSRRMASQVAASHRSGRSEEEKRQSAETASEMYQEETGYPLEINKEGEVVVEK